MPKDREFVGSHRKREIPPEVAARNFRTAPPTSGQAVRLTVRELPDETPASVLGGISREGLTAEVLRGARAAERVLFTALYGEPVALCALAGVPPAELEAVLDGQQAGLTPEQVLRLVAQLKKDGHGSFKLTALCDVAEWPLNNPRTFPEPTDDELRAIPPEQRASLDPEKLKSLRATIAEEFSRVFGSLAAASLAGGMNRSQLSDALGGHNSLGLGSIESLRMALQRRGYASPCLTVLRAPRFWPLPCDFLLWPGAVDLSAATRGGQRLTLSAPELTSLRARVEVAMLTLPGVNSFQGACMLTGMDRANLWCTLRGVHQGLRPRSYAELERELRRAGYQVPSLVVLSNPRYWPIVLDSTTTVVTDVNSTSQSNSNYLALQFLLPGIAHQAALAEAAATDQMLLRMLRLPLLHLLAHVLNAPATSSGVARALKRNVDRITNFFAGQESASGAWISTLAAELRGDHPWGNWLQWLRAPGEWNRDAAAPTPRGNDAERRAWEFVIPTVTELAAASRFGEPPALLVRSVRQRVLALLCKQLGLEFSVVQLATRLQLPTQNLASIFSGARNPGATRFGELVAAGEKAGLAPWMFESLRAPSRWPRLE